MDVENLLKVRIIIGMILLCFFLLDSLQTKAQHLEKDLNQIIENDPNLNGAIIGVTIRQASTGEILYEHNGEIRLRPASNMKLLTAATALSLLGENYTFKTELYTDGNIRGHTLKGNLFLAGKGDPTLQKKDLNSLAVELKKKGIEKIEGNLIGDDSWFDGVRLSQDMIWSDEERYYGAQISALTVSPDDDFDAGSVIIEVSPGNQIGAPGKINVIPHTNYVNIENRVTTVSPDGQAELIVKRVHGTNTIKMEGMIPLKASKKRDFMAVWEPTGLALDLFKQSLDEEGITLTGKVKMGSIKAGKNLVSHSSIPLSELLIPFMKLSNNVHAEILIKELGKTIKDEGSWEKGLEVMKEQLGKFGMNKELLVIRDGSGISHLNLVTTREMTQLLFYVQKEPWFPAFYSSLPIAGERDKMVGGTLRRRMEGLPVKAKTGTLTTVTSISGYAKTESGEKLIFSIIINNLLDEDKGKEVEDKFIETMIKD